MKTKQEIKEEIIELYGAIKALDDAMNTLHTQRMEKSKQMMALNHMFKDMGDDEFEEKKYG
jgi:peptidoglycan hydrolase CwlO-like protein